jgi:signal-transduction protein with cAMP-binding, CBS, and nucleotidyltransferase domain
MTRTKAAVRDRKLLEQSPLFAGMRERARRELVAQALPRSFVAGEPICHLGDPGLSMMAVVAGTVRISLPTVKGREIILVDLPAGELFGEIALLDGKPRSANATALMRRPTGRRSTSYDSRRRGSAKPEKTAASFQPRSKASPMPVFIP